MLKTSKVRQATLLRQTFEISMLGNQQQNTN